MAGSVEPLVVWINGAFGVGKTWAHERVERCVTALAGSRFAEHVDATAADPRELAGRVQRIVGELIREPRA